MFGLFFDNVLWRELLVSLSDWAIGGFYFKKG